MATATYIPIATQTLGSAAASITFSSIPGTYTDLRLVLTAQETVVANSGNDYVSIQFNGDTATNYSLTAINGQGASASSGYVNSLANLRANPLNGMVGSPYWGLYTIDLFSYSGSTNKTLLSTYSEDANGSGGSGCAVGLWRSTAAITSIKLFTVTNNFATGTIATLFGI